MLLIDSVEKKLFKSDNRDKSKKSGEIRLIAPKIDETVWKAVLFNNVH